jgi:iron complex transport system ATP-binding protein
VNDILTLEGVSFSYGAAPLFRDLGFTVRSGEFIGLLGPNGCGKTSLLQLIAGVSRPERGRILLQGKSLNEIPRNEIARMVSVLPQETFVEFPFTALEVVLMGRSPYLKRFQWEGPRDLEIAQEAMRLTDCLEFAERDVRSLSGGERERVLLARALAQEPKILLLDEPTTHLDLKHQSEIFRLLRKLHVQQGLTLIVVLHDLNFAATACQRLLLLAGGRLQADGAPADVLKAGTIREVFGAEVWAGREEKSGRPFFLPLLP